MLQSIRQTNFSFFNSTTHTHTNELNEFGSIENQIEKLPSKTKTQNKHTQTYQNKNIKKKSK